MHRIVAVSGGKDSTALALRLLDLYPTEEFTYFCTPTGDELPEVVEYWKKLARMLGKPIFFARAKTDLNGLISTFGALPNWRQRWCTRILKIEPMIAYLKTHQPAELFVGLRADEEERQGLYGDYATYRFPLREWGWGLKEVRGYLEARGICVPERTDCARCYGQTIYQWKQLWLKHPDLYQSAVEQEQATGATFRSPGRDTWPARLDELREEFKRGRKIRGEAKIIEDQARSCRVCRI